MGKTNSEATQAEKKVAVITRVFDAPRDLVFKAWTDPEHFAQWYGPQGFGILEVEMDVRPGGAYSLQMQGPDGTLYPEKGVFQEVFAPERLVFLATGPEAEDGNPTVEMLNTVTFEDQEGKTKLTLQIEVVRATPEMVQMLGGAQQGWNQAFDKLAEHLAAHSR